MANDKSAISGYVRGLYSYQPLPLDEERKLSGMIQAGDRPSLERLVKHNLRFVISVVKSTPEWRYSVVPHEDLIAMGNEALLKAARKWVPKNNARFATYAKPFIIRGVRRAIDNEWGLIRLPVNVSEEIRRVKYAERALMQRLGRDPTNEEIAHEAKTHPDRVVQLNNLIARGPISLESFSPENFQEEDEE